jgi:isoquinoline 1-oxidoreductase subunit beta
MTTHNEHDIEISRRGFVAGTAGLAFGFAIPGFLGAMSGPAAAATNAAQKTIGGWVTIGTDGAITIVAPSAEMGQGIFTGMPMIVAEELDADWSKVSSVFPPAVAAPPVYGNPAFGGPLLTVGSSSVAGYWDKARLIGAQARRVLMQAAADKWKVPLAEVTTGPSVVIHAKSGRRMSYGDIAKFATVPAELPKVDPSELKKPSDYRIVGKSVARLDTPAKVNGKAQYGMDVQVPNMVYATLLRAPVEGAAPDQIDDSAVKQIPGIIRTLTLKDAVAVVGNSVEGVFAGRNALKVVWKGGATAGYNSEAALEEYGKRLRNPDQKGMPLKPTGDVDAAFAKAAKVITSEYLTDYVHHAQMEPMNITASVNDAANAAEIWVGTQAPTPVAAVAAAVLKTEAGKIQIHQQFLGGGFGRRIYWDLVAYVLLTSKEMKRPVKMIWPREQDMQSALLRPMSAHSLQAALSDKGEVLGWKHRLVAEATLGYAQPGELVKTKGFDYLTLEGVDTNYAIEGKAAEWLREDRGTALAAWRAIGSGFNKFAIEAFIDDIALELTMDPIELRLKLLRNHPRGQKVLQTVADMAAWGKPAQNGHALGVAYADIWSTPTAGIAEVSVDRGTGKIRVHNFWNAVNPGIVVNPKIVESQSESNVIYGLSQALKERITLVDGAVAQSNFSDYEVLRMSEAPEIHTRVIVTDDKPTGIGEIVLPLVAPAVSNAVLALTGKRLNHLPMTPERVKAALA